MGKKSLIITGGGTAGHIYPGLSISKEIKKRHKDIDIFWVGTSERREREMVEKEGIKFYNISSDMPPFSLNLNGIRKSWRIIKGVLQSLNLIRILKPDLVLGMGAYSSVPFSLAAWILKIPLIIHEQNYIPGKANFYLSRFAQKIMISFPQTADYFDKCRGGIETRKRKKIVITGNPVREYEEDIPTFTLFKELNLNPSYKTILVFGGSQGAGKINQALLSSLPYLTDLTGWQVLHITGKDKYMEVKRIRDSIDWGNLNYQITDYLFELPLLLKEVELVICRAGASTCAELSIAGKPAILIPLSTKSGEHQRLNAKALKEVGGVRVLEEKELTGQKLANLIKELINKEEELKRMGERIKRLAMPNAKEKICEVIEEILKI